MNIYFEDSGNYITAELNGKVVIRCNSDYTDIRDTEQLEAFIKRHGGERDCAVYLRECYVGAAA